MLAAARLPADGPHLSVRSHLQLDWIKWARRGTIQNISGLRVKSAIVARTFEALVCSFEVNRTSQVRAFLAKSVQFAIQRADENGGVFRRRIAEVQK
jgi:hypothetical protein